MLDGVRTLDAGTTNLLATIIKIVRTGPSSYRLSVGGRQLSLSLGAGGTSLSGSGSFSYPDSGGTTNLSHSFNMGLTSLTGQGSWSWSNPNGSNCSGTSQFSGSKTS